MRDLVATPGVGLQYDSEDAADNALDKAGAALENGGAEAEATAKSDDAASVVVEATQVSTTVSSTTLRIDLPTPPSTGGSEAVVVNGTTEKPKVNAEEKHMLGHGCGEDDGDDKKDDEASNYADAEEEAKPDDAEKKPDDAEKKPDEEVQGDSDKKPDDDAKPPVESDTADAPPPVPLSPLEMQEESMPEGGVDEQAGPVHYIFCDGCKNGTNIVGVRWKCLECADYDLCDKCHSTGAHDEHEMLRIEHPDDYQSVELSPLVDDADSLLLGLRVYTKQDAPVKISGQLRRGQLMRWKKSI